MKKDSYQLFTAGPTTITVQGVKDSYSITVDDTTNLSIGQFIGVFGQGATQFYFGNITDIVGSVVSLDTPLDFDYPIGSPVQPLTREIAVDGTLPNRQIFQVGPGAQSNLTIDVTRILFKIITTTPAEFNDFGDLAELANGIVLRINSIQFSIIIPKRGCCQQTGNLRSIMPFFFNLAINTLPIF